MADMTVLVDAVRIYNCTVLQRNTVHLRMLVNLASKRPFELGHNPQTNCEGVHRNDGIQSQAGIIICSPIIFQISETAELSACNPHRSADHAVFAEITILSRSRCPQEAMPGTRHASCSSTLPI